MIYSPAQALDLLAFRHEWGEGYIPGDPELSMLQMEAEGSTALIAVYTTFAAIFEHTTDMDEARQLLQFVTVPTAIEPFIAEFDTVRTNLRDRGLGTRPYFVSPEVAYVKLPPDPKIALVSTAEKALPPGTIFATMQRCPDLEDVPEAPFDHWRVFGLGGPWPIEQIAPRLVHLRHLRSAFSATELIEVVGRSGEVRFA